jgi:hypothetical protein
MDHITQPPRIARTREQLANENTSGNFAHDPCARNARRGASRQHNGPSELQPRSTNTTHDTRENTCTEAAFGCVAAIGLGLGAGAALTLLEGNFKLTGALVGGAVAATAVTCLGLCAADTTPAANPGHVELEAVIVSNPSNPSDTVTNPQNAHVLAVEKLTADAMSLLDKWKEVKNDAPSNTYNEAAQNIGMIRTAGQASATAEEILQHYTYPIALLHGVFRMNQST